jgi:hypothetical protein
LARSSLYQRDPLEIVGFNRNLSYALVDEMLPAQRVSFPLGFTRTCDILMAILDRTWAKNPNGTTPIGLKIDSQNVFFAQACLQFHFFFLSVKLLKIKDLAKNREKE